MTQIEYSGYAKLASKPHMPRASEEYQEKASELYRERWR